MKNMNEIEELVNYVITLGKEPKKKDKLRVLDIFFNDTQIEDFYLDLNITLLGYYQYLHVAVSNENYELAAKIKEAIQVELDNIYWMITNYYKVRSKKQIKEKINKINDEHLDAFNTKI